LGIPSAIHIAKSVVAVIVTVRLKSEVQGESMRRVLARLSRDDRGLTTAEYAVGTVAAAGLGGLLIKLLTSDWVRDLIWNLIKSAISVFFPA
jgi:Flp pilus assembly pilin Flp